MSEAGGAGTLESQITNLKSRPPPSSLFPTPYPLETIVQRYVSDDQVLYSHILHSDLAKDARLQHFQGLHKSRARRRSDKTNPVDPQSGVFRGEAPLGSDLAAISDQADFEVGVEFLDGFGAAYPKEQAAGRPTPDPHYVNRIQVQVELVVLIHH